MFTSALAYSRAGFPVVPVAENAKNPHHTGAFRNGGKSATLDYQRVQDHWYEHPDDNVGLGSNGTVVFADIDPRNGGSLEVAERLGVPVDGYREITAGGGWHLPLVMPAGIIATTSATIAPGVELKAAGLYVVSAHSRINGSWYRPEPRRDTWQFGRISDRWEFLERLTEPAIVTSSLTILQDDEDEAARILTCLLNSTDYAETVAMVLEGGWEDRYPTRSEADAALAYMASHFVREYERPREALYVLLRRHSLKAHSHANPDYYVLITIDHALHGRHSKDADHVYALGDIIQIALTAPPKKTAPTVYDPTLWVRRGKQTALMRDVLAFAGAPSMDGYAQANGWRRLPVNHMSALRGVSSECVRRAQIGLVDMGLIERAPRPKRHDGGPRMDARIRITDKGRDVLDAIRLGMLPAVLPW